MKKVFFSLAITLLTIPAFAENANKDGSMSLTDLPSGNILFGEVFLDEADKTVNASDNDTFALPGCDGMGGNEPVIALRLNAPKKKPNGNDNLDALIKKISLIFNNGQTHEFDPQDGWLKVTDQEGDNIRIDFANPRCIRAVSILGEQYEGGMKAADTYVRVIGVVQK